MPLDPQPTEWGLRLRFIACPSDSIEVRVTPVAPGNQGCIVACRRGEGAKAALGVMGPQIASLIRASELELHNRLEYDLRAAFPSAVSPVTVNLDAATGTLMSGGPKSKQHTDYAADAEVVTEAAPKAAAPEGPKLPRYDGSDDDEARAQEAAAEEEHQVEPSPEEEEEEDPLESLELPEALRAVDPKDLDAPSRAVKALGDAALREADAAAGKRRPAQGAVSSESSEAAAASDEEEEVMLLKAIAQDSGADSLDLSVPKTFRDAVVETARAANLTDEKVAELFRRGASFASETGQALVASGRAGDRAGALAEGRVEVADKELVRLRVAFEGSQLEGGVDLFDGPKQPSGGPNGAGGSGAGLVDGSAAGTARAAKRYAAALNVSGALPGSPEASAAARGLAFSFFKPHVADPSTLESAEDRRALEATRRSLGRIVRELARPGGNDTLFYPIMSTYRDVVLSEWYPSAMRTLLEANSDPEDQETRKLLALINDYALTCAEELGSVMATSERAQLEKIRQICQVAMDDMQKLPAFVRSMRPALDRDLVAYLGYAVDSERNAIEAKFLDPDREPSQWLQVLGLVRQGVHAELVKDLREDIKSIMYVLRMPDEFTRRELLRTTIDSLPTWDIRQFNKVATNIVDSIALREVAGAVDPDLASKVRQLGVDLREFLPPARLSELARPADEARGLLGADGKPALDDLEMAALSPAATLAGVSGAGAGALAAEIAAGGGDASAFLGGDPALGGALGGHLESSAALPLGDQDTTRDESDEVGDDGDDGVAIKKRPPRDFYIA